LPLPESQPPAEAAPALTELIAAGLVSHEVIGDPARLGGETAALEALCRLVAGPVYRIDAFHYGFRAGPDDLGGRLAALPPGDWTAALAAALAAAVGPEAAWLARAEPEDPGLAGPAAPLDRPLLFLQAQAAAVGTALAAADPGLQAVVDAGYAAGVARLTAAALEAELDSTLANRLEARIAAVLEGVLEAVLETRLAALAGRLDAGLARLERLTETAEAAAAGMAGETAREAAGAAAFRESLGLTLAEFLARLERHEAETTGRSATGRAPRVPLFS